MKTITACMIALLFALAAFSQNSKGISYQKILRDFNGDVMANAQVHLQLKILAFDPGGEAVYSEYHHLMSNSFGLVNLVIGTGEDASSDFEAINWGAGDHFLEISIDPEGDGDYQMMGVTQFLSVPYALHARNGIQAMTTEARDALENPFTGMQIFNTSTNCLNYYNGFSWFENCGNCTPLPSQAYAGEDQYFSDETVTAILEAGYPQYGNGQWSIIEGVGGIFEDESDPQTTFTGQSCEQYLLKWTVSNYCGSTEDIVQIIFDTQPTEADAGEDQILPVDSTSTYLSANTPLKGIGFWTIQSGLGGILADSLNPETFFNGLLNATYVLRWTISTECNSTWDEVEILTGVSSQKTIQILFAEVPTFIAVDPSVLRHNMQHVVTLEQDDNLIQIHNTLLPLLKGGVPLLEPGYNSPGRFTRDIQGNLTVPMKANTTSWLYRLTSGGDTLNEFQVSNCGFRLCLQQLDDLIEAGFGLNSHGLFADLDDLPDLLPQSASRFCQWMENRYGVGNRPFNQVRGGQWTNICPAGYETWKQVWFEQGAPYGQLKSGGNFIQTSTSGQNGEHPVRIDRDISTFTGQIQVGRWYIERPFLVNNNFYVPDMLNALVNRPFPSWCRAGGHGITNNTGFVWYSDVRLLFDLIQSDYSDRIWVPSVPELIKYFHVRDNVVINKQIDGNVLTITFDDSNIPEYVQPRFLTFKVVSDQIAQGIIISGENYLSHGLGTNEILIDLMIE